MPISIKTSEDIVHMRIACQLASEVLDYITPFVKAGITTAKLDELCHRYMIETQHTIPAPLNYQPAGFPPFPKSVCISVNDVVCHGIPSDRILKDGDCLNIDVTVIKNNYYGDTSRMYFIGKPSILAKRLTQVTYECMWRGIESVKPGAYLGDIGAAIQEHAENAGFSVVREYCGHGIGKTFHEDPQILHYGKRGTGLRIRKGMIFTIEPMINAGSSGTRQMADKWTVKTRDRSLSAQWEHTVLVTHNGYEVLTLSDGYPMQGFEQKKTN